MRDNREPNRQSDKESLKSLTDRKQQEILNKKNKLKSNEEKEIEKARQLLYKEMGRVQYDSLGDWGSPTMQWIRLIWLIICITLITSYIIMIIKDPYI
ncbi:MAG: hypothetical protein HYS16_00925 [Deltaproteobacteria bacterium]|nr:MAG: hypothetical protein HYS16_00925 [Deltaproteobacteria bacterium]